MIRLSDLQEAEKAVDRAMLALRAYSDDPTEWSAHERMGDNDMRQLIIHKAHFERLEVLQRNVENAAGRLRGIQAAFAGGGA